ncbi:peptidoglycan DD-metalloendopeptidase family protein [Patescibacteria group bacterium]|nr:peptidoglycan DD-metalloendopeptidase family protein [Patescibacteria group bacterium]
MKVLSKRTSILFLVIGVIFTSSFFHVEAQNINDLEAQIAQKSQERKELEAEADRIREELTKVGAEKGVLQAELNRINAERKSLDNTIKQTENEIASLELKINKSEQQISRYTSEIKTHADAIAALLRGMEQQETLSFLEVLSSATRLSDFFQIRDAYARLQEPLVTTTQLLEKKKVELYTTNQELAQEQAELESEKVVLGDQRLIVKSKEDEKAQVLNQTKQKESSTQQSLVATLATIEALDAEIRDFESKLQFALNPESIPKRGSAVFDWPLDSILITQRFGKTVSSQRLYVSGSHSGMDFRAAVGTPVYAVADGIVKGVGDTDEQCYRASFGKWVFIEHEVGLSTTSAHLSSWKVSAGDHVKKGDLIGYSGNTGHSTAPHLHITVYATKGVNGEQGARITERPSSACPGTNYRMPLAPTSAYLDPLDYFPATDVSYFKYPSLQN